LMDAPLEVPQPARARAVVKTSAWRTAPPARRLRVTLALAAGVLSGVRALLWSVGESKARDIDQVWYAAHALLAGRNPYAEIGPGLAFDWPAFFYYPLTSVLAIAPLIPLPRPAAAAAFAALASAAFVWAATRRSLVPAMVITSASAAFAAEAVQWSPLLGAAFAAPWLGVFLSAKPTIGLAVFAARPTRIAVIGGMALVAAALLLQPTWPMDWLQAVRHTSLLTPGGTPYLAPIATPGGAFAILALLRWRRPEARLVFALACVPQTPLLYETVPLFLVPATIIEGGVLWLGSWLVALWVSLAGPFATDLPRFLASGRAIGWLLYLPCVVMILRRPNVGALPSWLEDRLASSRIPRRLRGEPEPV
jgi:hypothetical protein